MREFTNVGHMSGGRLFPGFVSSAKPKLTQIFPRQAHAFSVQQGDLLRIDTTGQDVRLALLAFAVDGQRSEAAFGLPDTQPLTQTDFDVTPLTGWLASHGGDASALQTAILLTQTSEPLVLSAPHAATVWLISGESSSDLVGGASAGPINIWHQPADDTIILPPPLGEVRDEFTIKRGTARAYELFKGESVQIIDVEGQQCSDFQALRMQGLDDGKERLIDSTATRSMVHRAYPMPGMLDKFYDADMRPLFRVIQDTCGRHDTFGLACTARGYEERGFPGHVNCSDNLSSVFAPFGVLPRSAWPAINFFWNTWMDAHHQIQTEEAHSRPGDYVVMEAMDDMVCASTACPDDIDPINGWNPTDIHIRIYTPKTRIQRAVAYRSKEDAPMQISRPSAFHKRLETLTDNFAPSRDLWAPVSFPTHGTLGEYWACRKAATLQDMSGLRKFDIVGPDAERLLQIAMSRDVAKLAVWRGTYALLCDDSGEVIDDGTLFRLAPQLFRWCCGTEESGRWLTHLAEQQNFQVRIHDLGGSLPNLALQGPKSRDILRKITFTQPTVPALDHMKWFGATVARLHDRDGAPFMLSRTGYTGELGYELFCSEGDALVIWDALMEAGADEGLIPMGSAALDIIRIEAGLMGSAEFSPGFDAYEAGLGFAIDLNKTEFIGKEALARNAASQRRILRGLMFDCDDVPLSGAPVFDGERQVGVITSATRSPLFETAVAMARLTIEHAALGHNLEVGQLDGRMKRLTAKIVDLPFYDPKRERARA